MLFASSSYRSESFQYIWIMESSISKLQMRLKFANSEYYMIEKKRCGLRIEPIQIAVFMHTFGMSDFRLGYVEGKKNGIRSSIGMTNKRNKTPFLLPKKPQ